MKFGEDYDIVPAVFPQNVDGGAEGFRVSMTNYGGAAVVGFFGAAHSIGATNIGVTLEQHDDPVAGTTMVLPVVERYYWKGGDLLEADTPWETNTQAANEEWGEDSWDPIGVDLALMTLASVESEDLAEGFEWMSATIIDTTAGHDACLFYVLYDLKIQRDPVDLPITLAP